MVDIKEYTSTGLGTEGSLLIEKKIYPELIKAVQKKLIGRQYAALYIGPDGIPGSSIDVNLETADSINVVRVAEGASVPVQVNGYTSFNLKPVKYGVRPFITKEMAEDGKFPLLQFNVMRAGVELAENETSLIITQALDNASNTVAGGTAVSIANVTRAMQYLEDSDFHATTLLVGPEVANDLRNIDTFVEADKLGSREAFENGLVGKVYGMEVVEVSAALITSTSAYVFDKSQAFVIAEKRPITVESYDDKTRDLSGAVITQRLVCRQLRAGSIAKITSS